MQLLTNIALLVEGAVFALVAFTAGNAAIEGATILIRRAGGGVADARNETNLSVSLLVGYGICAVAGMVLAIAHVFYWWSLLLAATLLLVGWRHRLASLARAAQASLRALWRARDPLWIACFVLVAAQLGAMVFATLAPPFAYDELAYHLPQARLVAFTHSLPLDFGNFPFPPLYANIPKLFEVLFAEGIALSGYSLPHVLHASVFVAFVGTAYSVVRGLYGPRAAIVAAALIATLPMATWNAQTMYIDAGTSSFECAALLLTLVWVVDHRPADLAAAALLSGFALSAKYSSAPTIAFAGLLLVIGIVRAQDRTRDAKAVAAAALITATLCGYWYVKNLVRFGNPFYPLYFGHRGVSAEDYQSLISALHEFGPRSLRDFLHLPQRFARPIEVPAFLIFAVAPFAVFIRRRSFVAISLAIYFMVYVAYWFFMATHQTRFLMPALFAGSIAAAVAVSCGPTPARLAAAAMALVALLALHPRTTLTGPNLREDIRNKLGFPTAAYIIGRESQDEFLGKYFGCQYLVVRYLPHHGLQGGVVDDWTQWFGYNLAPYIENAFEPLPSNASTIPAPELERQLVRQGFRYIYVKDSHKTAFAETPYPSIRRWRTERLAADEYLVQHAELVYRAGDCSLYRLAFASTYLLDPP